MKPINLLSFATFCITFSHSAIQLGLSRVFVMSFSGKTVRHVRHSKINEMLSLLLIYLCQWYNRKINRKQKLEDFRVLNDFFFQLIWKSCWFDFWLWQNWLSNSIFRFHMTTNKQQQNQNNNTNSNKNTISFTYQNWLRSAHFTVPNIERAWL